jgi:hypothetical protein
MITSDEAHRIATEVIGPATAGGGQGWHLEEFDAGWLVRADWTSDRPVRGGSFCVVERVTGRVLAFPLSISPTRIMTEYDQLVDRASQLSGSRELKGAERA